MIPLFNWFWLLHKHANITFKPADITEDKQVAFPQVLRNTNIKSQNRKKSDQVLRVQSFLMDTFYRAQLDLDGDNYYDLFDKQGSLCWVNYP